MGEANFFDRLWSLKALNGLKMKILLLVSATLLMACEPTSKPVSQPIVAFNFEKDKAMMQRALNERPFTSHFRKVMRGAAFKRYDSQSGKVFYRGKEGSGYVYGEQVHLLDFHWKNECWRKYASYKINEKPIRYGRIICFHDDGTGEIKGYDVWEGPIPLEKEKPF